MSGPELVVDGLTVRFGGLTALDALQFRLSAGEFVGLIGPNGSGKTTFFNALTGIYAPASGQVALSGKDITGLPPQQIYDAGITRTFQRLRLASSLSVFDNLMIGNHRNLSHGIIANLFARQRLKNEIEENVAKSRLLLEQFSAPLASRLFDPVSQLTMIDRRRVEVCRALISEPKILLLDEPSAGMTHEETRALMDDLLASRERMPGLAIVLIEHEMGVIERVTDRCVVLNYGEKIAEGSYREVASNSDVRTAYLGED
ncbi:MAG: branched-chain amino acid ABC transporter ATP-binding protein [Betaproteobacteria bacterium SG8_40]|jgi:ABC-type branched-subunit amino acid transport system ATPase component|nr:MAG: branched-chain amino acid ABC transporter ATP-binding protein [Betaproteobacteria bacterium SG8_40]